MITALAVLIPIVVVLLGLGVSVWDRPTRHARALERIAELEVELDPAGDGLAWTDDDENASSPQPPPKGLPNPYWIGAPPIIVGQGATVGIAAPAPEPEKPRRREMPNVPVLDDDYFERKHNGVVDYENADKISERLGELEQRRRPRGYVARSSASYYAFGDQRVVRFPGSYVGASMSGSGSGVAWYPDPGPMQLQERWP